MERVWRVCLVKLLRSIFYRARAPQLPRRTTIQAKLSKHQQLDSISAVFQDTSDTLGLSQLKLRVKPYNMADSQPPATAAPAAAATDLESKEIWGDEADQLDEDIMKVECVKCDMVVPLRATISSLLWSGAHRQGCSRGGSYTDCLQCLMVL